MTKKMTRKKKRRKTKKAMIDADKLRAAMMKKCFTQGGLAKEAGLSRQTIDDALKGRGYKNPNIKTIGRLCAALDVKPEDICKQEGCEADGKRVDD